MYNTLVVWGPWRSTGSGGILRFRESDLDRAPSAREEPTELLSPIRLRPDRLGKPRYTWKSGPAARPMGFTHPCNPKAYQLLGVRIGSHFHFGKMLGHKLHIAGNIHITAQGRGMPNPCGSNRGARRSRLLALLRSPPTKSVTSRALRGWFPDIRQRRPKSAVEVAPINSREKRSTRGNPSPDQRPKGMGRA